MVSLASTALNWPGGEVEPDLGVVARYDATDEEDVRW